MDRFEQARRKVAGRHDVSVDPVPGSSDSWAWQCSCGSAQLALGHRSQAQAKGASQLHLRAAMRVALREVRLEAGQ